MKIFTQKDVQSTMPLSKIKRVIVAVEKAFFDYSENVAKMPPKQYLDFPQHNGDLRIMPSYSNCLKMAATKIVSVHPDNPKSGLKTVMASIVINDIKTGVALALMDGTYITGIRTGAASAVATKYLARKNSKTLGIVGAGQQAVYQIAALMSVIHFKEVLVFDINKNTFEKLRKILGKEGIKIKYAELEKVSGQDVLVTTTPSREPIIKREWVRPGTHINAIGADAAGKQELDPEILKESKIVVDDWMQASHSGEINVPIRKKEIRENNIWGNLGDIVSGKKRGRVNQDEITVFDSTGLAIQDLYAAYLVFGAGKSKKEIELHN